MNMNVLLLRNTKPNNMYKLLILLMALAWLSINSLQAQVKVAESAKLPVNPKVKIGQLPNGLTYYIQYNQKPEKKVELRLAVNAGAILEDDDQQGLAHFMEHMNFNGLKHFPGNELVHYLQSIGVGFGNDLNAFTGFDQTVYILPVPSDDAEKLDKAFTVLADWSGASLLTDEEIDKERGVILEESRLGKGADDRMMKRWLPAMLNGSKYADRLPIGKDEIIANFPHEVLRRFHSDWYRPNQQAVIVVGDMPVEKAEAMIIEKFGGFSNPVPDRPRPAVFDVKPFTSSKAMVCSDNEASSTSVMILGSMVPREPVNTEEGFMDNLTQDLFMSMLNMRLSELMSKPDPPFAGAYAFLGSGWARGYESFGIQADCGYEQISKAVDALVTEAMRAKKFGFTESELMRAKAETLSNYEKSYNERDKTESGRIVWEYVNNFLEGEGIPGIEWEYNFVKDHIGSISMKDLAKLKDKIDIDKNYFALITAKAQPGLLSDADLKALVDKALATPVTPYTEKVIADKLLAKDPVPGKVVKTEKNEKLGTTTYTLQNGITVCVKPTDFKNDEILLKGSRFGGFSVYKGADYQSAQFSNNVVEDMGFGEFSKTDLEKFLSGKIANATAIVDQYVDQVSGNSSVKDFETMLQLLYLKCTSPRLDADAGKSYISRMKQQMESVTQEPQYLFMDSSYNVLYRGNPRAHLIEKPTDYDKINLQNAVDFYKQRLCNLNGMYFNIVGSIPQETIVPLIEKYLGGLPTKPINAMYSDLGLEPLQGKQAFTLHKGSEPKALVAHYITGKAQYNPDDNFKLSQLNAVINVKVVDTIREKMSAIYGGGCGGSLSKYPREEFTIRSRFPCSPENTEKVNQAFLDLLASATKDGGITPTDWDRVLEPALESNKVNLKRNDFWLNGLQNAFLNGTNPERLLTVEERLKAITPDQLIETARKFYTTPNVFKAVWLPAE